MKLSGIAHAAIVVSDYEKARDFYVNKLGFSVIQETVREAQGDIRLDLRLGEIGLEIFALPGAPERDYAARICGLWHLAFQVESVPETAKWLNSIGIETEPVRPDPANGRLLTFFRDPDGLPLEIHE